MEMDFCRGKKHGRLRKRWATSVSQTMEQEPFRMKLGNTK